MMLTIHTLDIVVAFLSFGLLFCGFFSTIYGVIAYFIVMTLRLGLIFPLLGAIRIELLFAIIVFIQLAIHGEIGKIINFDNKLYRAVVTLFFVAMVSVVQSVNVVESWTLGGLEFLKVFLFFLMMVAVIHTSADLRLLVISFCFVAGCIAYEPFYNYISGVSIAEDYGAVAIGRFGASTGHVALANTICQAIPVVYFTRLGVRNIYGKLIFTILLILLFTAVVLTKSRGGFIGLIVIMAGVVWFSENRFKSICLSLLLVIGILAFSGDEYLSHMSSIVDGVGGSRSTSDRWLGLVNGVEMFLKRPLLGVGIGAYATARSHYFNYYFYSHNLYGELLGELGLASFFWFKMVYLILKASYSRRINLNVNNIKENYLYWLLCGIQLSIVVRLILGNFSHCAFIWFWFFMAALVVAIENAILKEQETADKPVLSSEASKVGSS